jgi:outer membrane protein OmpA-like peptidoglycan-associated protein
MHVTRRRVGASALAAALALGAGGTTAADEHRGTGIDANLFKPALDPNGFFTIERGGGMKRFDFALTFDSFFAQRPLKLDTLYGTGDMGADGTSDPILQYQLGFDFGFAFGLSDRLTLGFDMPVTLQPLDSGYGEAGRYAYDPTNPTAATRPGTGFYSTRPDQNTRPSENGPGDLRLSLKYTILRGKSNLAAQVIAYVPFGDEDVFAGSYGATVEPRLIYDTGLGKKAHLAVNAGVRIRQGELAETRNTDTTGTVIDDPMTGNAIYYPKLFVGTEASIGVGAVFDVSSRFSAGVATNWLIPVLQASDAECGSGCKNGDLTGQVLGGLVFGMGADKKLGLSAGTSVIPGAARAPSFLLALSFTWSPSVEGARISSRGDSDGDGIPDGADICPDEPEDKDGFQDDDGCPELDNDLDGVLDAQDKCPDEPEDRDGYQDDDGCPEGDNDNDGVPDLNDRCPKEAEDKDGFDDDDGCPDEDNDGDGILDAQDQCPNEPETINGYQDLDGCPDQAAQGGAKLAATSIDLQGDKVDFVGKSDKLTRASEGVLDGVAGVMNKNKNIKFRVEVGVEQSGTKPKDKAADQRLSEQRADAVKAYLVKKGVDPDQIDVAGLGSARPIDKDPKSVKNRRVEFIRVTQ